MKTKTHLSTSWRSQVVSSQTLGLHACSTDVQGHLCPAQKTDTIVRGANGAPTRCRFVAK